MLALLLSLLFGAPQTADGPVTVRVTTPEEQAAVYARVNPAAQGDWRVLSDETGTAMAVDIGNVLSEDATRTVWLAQVGAESLPPETYAVFRMKLDCEARTAQPLFMALRRADGSNLFGQSLDDAAAPYGTESGGAQVAALVCEGQTPTSQSFPTHQAFAASVAVR